MTRQRGGLGERFGMRGWVGYREHRLRDLEDFAVNAGVWDGRAPSLPVELQPIAARFVAPSRRVRDPNSVLNVGVQAIITSILAGAAYYMDTAHGYLAIGTGTAAPAVTDTGLQSENARYALASSARDGNYLRTTMFLNSTQGNNVTYTEMGLVNASSGGTFLNHGLLSSSITKTSAKTATFDCDILWTPS
jgi:hypothetical protein